MLIWWWFWGFWWVSGSSGDLLGQSGTILGPSGTILRQSWSSMVVRRLPCHPVVLRVGLVVIRRQTGNVLGAIRGLHGLSGTLPVLSCGSPWWSVGGLLVVWWWSGVLFGCTVPVCGIWYVVVRWLCDELIYV